MNLREQQLLREEVGDAEPRLFVLSRARVDAGRWWRRTPVWICVVGEELVMLAVARRRYIERVAISECEGTHYNHAAGELVIEPGEGLRMNRFRVSPRVALKILSMLKPNKESFNTEN